MSKHRSKSLPEMVEVIRSSPYKCLSIGDVLEVIDKRLCSNTIPCGHDHGPDCDGYRYRVTCRESDEHEHCGHRFIRVDLTGEREFGVVSLITNTKR